MEIYDKNPSSDNVLPVVIVVIFKSLQKVPVKDVGEDKMDLVMDHQDLEYLCEGVEGRSSNPVAVLFDALLLPDGDFGVDSASPLIWRYEPQRAIPHLVLGKGPPGGAWHAMEGSMLTLSLANWMELPGLKLKDWMRDKRRSNNHFLHGNTAYRYSDPIGYTSKLDLNV